MMVETRRVMPLVEAGDLSAPPGSRLWALAVRLEIQALLHDKERNADRLQRNLEGMREHEGYRQLLDHDGQTYQSFEAFCVDQPPFGLGYDEQALDRIVRERADPHRQALGIEPLAEQGRGKGMNHTFKGKRNREYYLARLKRDHKDTFYAAYLRREYPSPHAAAIAAGFERRRLAVEPTVDGLARLAATHLSIEDRGALIARLRAQLDEVG